MSVINALFLNMGKVIPAYKMTPELAGQLHKNLAKVMVYVQGKGVKLTTQQSRYIMEQTRQLDLYEKGITPSTTKGPKATVTDITEKLKSTDPYSKKNPGGWMPDEAEEAAIQSRAGRPETGFSQNLVDDTINLLKDKDQKSMSDELKKLMLREGTYTDYNDTERKAILDGIQKILEARGGYLDYATGGRVGYAFGTGKKGVQGILDLVKDKFGKKSITTADKVARPESALTRDMFKQFNERLKQSKDRLLTDDEIKEYEEVLGDSETWMTKGTLEEAETAVKRQKDYEQQMYSEYKVDKQSQKELEQAYKEIDFRMTGEDTKYEANELADMLSEIRYKTEYYDLPQKTQLDLYDEAYNYLMEVKRDAANFKGGVNVKTGQNIVTKEQELPIDPMTGKPRKLNAKGGRVGFSAGGIDKARRAFLKILGAGAGATAATKTGLFGLLKGNKAKEMVKTAEKVGVRKDQPPAYVFDLVKIIRAKGKDITKEAQTIERETVKTYKGMDLYESPDGSFRIQADIPTKFGDQAKKVELMYAKTDEVVDAGMETQKTVKGEIYEEATVSPDIDGKMKDVEMYIDDIDHSVLEEFVDKEKKKFKSGGLAYMLGE